MQNPKRHKCVTDAPPEALGLLQGAVHLVLGDGPAAHEEAAHQFLLQVGGDVHHLALAEEELLLTAALEEAQLAADPPGGQLVEDPGQHVALHGAAVDGLEALGLDGPLGRDLAHRRDLPDALPFGAVDGHHFLFRNGTYLHHVHEFVEVHRSEHIALGVLQAVGVPLELLDLGELVANVRRGLLLAGEDLEGFGLFALQLGPGLGGGGRVLLEAAVVLRVGELALVGLLDHH